MVRRVTPISNTGNRRRAEKQTNSGNSYAPGLRALLETVEESDRRGWVVDPQTVEFQRDKSRDWVRPIDSDLEKLVQTCSNWAIARACRVSEASVRKWCRQIGADCGSRGRDQEVAQAVVEEIWNRGVRQGRTPGRAGSSRLSVERVGRIISRIGEEAGIVVRVDHDGQPAKFASAHDIRRGCDQPLINLGVSAETLKLILRHSGFATTEKSYGAVRSAQAAGKEVHSLDERVNKRNWPCF